MDSDEEEMRIQAEREEAGRLEYEAFRAGAEAMREAAAEYVADLSLTSNLLGVIEADSIGQMIRALPLPQPQ